MSTTTEAKLVKLWARVEAATVNSATGEVVHTTGVDPKYLAAELVREIQGLSQQLDAEKAKVADLTAKLEAATKATTEVTHTFGADPEYLAAELVKEIQRQQPASSV